MSGNICTSVSRPLSVNYDQTSSYQVCISGLLQKKKRKEEEKKGEKRKERSPAGCAPRVILTQDPGTPQIGNESEGANLLGRDC